MSHRPVIVVSATRFFQGGTLVIVAECLKFLSEHYSRTHSIKALVYKKELYEQMDPQLKDLEGIQWLEFADARVSIFHRLYHEYIKFKELSKVWRPVLWLSLQDSTPNVHAKTRAVYYHNPLLLAPDRLQIKLWRFQPRLATLRLLYKYIYTKGISKNDFVITQQSGIADYLRKTYHIQKNKIGIFPPISYLSNKEYFAKNCNNEQILTTVGSYLEEKSYTFIFAATAFYYKNHKVIFDACRALTLATKLKETDLDEPLEFKILLTIDGSENRYIQKLVSQAKKDLPQIKFLGFVNRDQLYFYYNRADCMIFPSFLESWGLPLTEFASLNKPILCADLPYGRSSLAGYKKACFFCPSNALELADQMKRAIQGSLNYELAELTKKEEDIYYNSWEDCFRRLLE